jgi:hypothetical protein
MAPRNRAARRLLASNRYKGEPCEFAEWLPVSAMETWFGFSKSTTYRLLAQGLIEGRKLGSRTLINVASVRRRLACQPRPLVKADASSARLAQPARSEETTAA